MLQALPVNQNELAPTYFSLQSTYFYIREYIQELREPESSVKEDPIDHETPENSGDNKDPE